MPQSLSKCRRPSHAFTSKSAAADGLQDELRRWCNRKRFNWQRKMDKVKFVPVPMQKIHICHVEDWESEIEEFSRLIEAKKEKERSDQMPYEAEEELKVALGEMSLYSVPRATRQNWQHYDPSKHHTPPVPWICEISGVQTDQFADAEE